MMSGFAFLTIAAVITIICVFICIVYVSYKIKEALNTKRLMDATFPGNENKLTRKLVRTYEDFYYRNSSNSRTAMGLFCTEDDIDDLRKKASLNRFPKGRYKI